MKDYLNTNKKLWDARTDVHFESDFYDIPSFLAGKDSLNDIEISLLGEVKGKTVLHLQCHFGQDSLSLARRGAKVTGVDFSKKAIEKARQLNQQLKLDASFIESDVYELDRKLDEQFDIVFTSYGVIGWLPDINRWAQTIARFLKPGGKFVMAEFHPVVWMFSDDFKTIDYSYNKSEAIETEEGTYTDGGSEIRNQSVCWNHGLAEVLSSLLEQGLELTAVREFLYSPYNCFQNTVEIGLGRFQIQGLENKIPMVYALEAIKKTST